MKFRLTVPGEPRARTRVRVRTVAGGAPVHFTANQDRSYESLVIDAWEREGKPKLPSDTPYALVVVARFARPKGHLNRHGELSASGRRSTYPTKRPDGDQLLKLPADVLVRVGALPDDALCVLWECSKVWTRNSAGLVVMAETMPGG